MLEAAILYGFLRSHFFPAVPTTENKISQTFQRRKWHFILWPYSVAWKLLRYSPDGGVAQRSSRPHTEQKIPGSNLARV
jgi:hypothetical protein